MEVSIYVMHWFQNMKNKELYKFLILYSKNTCSLMKDTAQTWNFPLRISSVNMTKFAVSCVFGQIYWKKL